MKVKSGRVALFVATLILGVLIAINIDLNGISSKQLTAKEYQDAIEERSLLYKQIAQLKKENREYAEKIDDYQENDEEHDKVLSDMRNQLNDYGMLTGFKEIKGPGLVITINDAIINWDEDTDYEIVNKILHDSDLALLINEVRAAGGEAIAINNHRVTPNTGVVCNNAFIGFEDDDREAAPFNMYVIGDTDLLEETLMKEGSHLRALKIYRGLDITIEKKDEIILPAAKAITCDYLQENLNK